MGTNEEFLRRLGDDASPTGIGSRRPRPLQRSHESTHRAVSVGTTTPTHTPYPRKGADGGFVNKFRFTEGVR
jgi:hypothetical protein